MGKLYMYQMGTFKVHLPLLSGVQISLQLTLLELYSLLHLSFHWGPFSTYTFSLDCCQRSTQPPFSFSLTLIKIFSTFLHFQRFFASSSLILLGYFRYCWRSLCQKCLAASLSLAVSRLSYLCPGVQPHLFIFQDPWDTLFCDLIALNLGLGPFHSMRCMRSCHFRQTGFIFF